MKKSKEYRLFIAGELPEWALARLQEEQRVLRGGDFPVRWASPGGIHLTLQFLGGVAADRVPALLKSLEAAAGGVGPFPLGLEGLGAFPNLRRPRVIWAGLSGDLASLSELQHRVVKAMKPLGFKAERRPFRPHLTLGRVRQGADAGALEALGRLVSGRELRADETWEETSISLIRSELLPGGARYTTLGRAVLGNE